MPDENVIQEANQTQAKIVRVTGEIERKKREKMTIERELKIVKEQGKTAKDTKKRLYVEKKQLREQELKLRRRIETIQNEEIRVLPKVKEAERKIRKLEREFAPFFAALVVLEKEKYDLERKFRGFQRQFMKREEDER